MLGDVESLVPYWLAWEGRELIGPLPSPFINSNPSHGHLKPHFVLFQQPHAVLVASELCLADAAGLTDCLFCGLGKNIFLPIRAKLAESWEVFCLPCCILEVQLS